MELGGFGALSNFGAVTYCNSPDFEGVSGILGFGTPTPGSLGSQPQPLPLLFILTGGSIDHVPPVEPGSNLLPVRAFSFHAKENAAELHLGGYDPAAVTGTMAVFPTVMPTQCVATAPPPFQNCNTLQIHGPRPRRSLRQHAAFPVVQPQRHSRHRWFLPRAAGLWIILPGHP